MIDFVRGKTDNQANKNLLESGIIPNSHTDLDTANAMFQSNVMTEKVTSML